MSFGSILLIGQNATRPIATRTAGISVSAHTSITAIAIANIGPIVFKLPDRASTNAIIATIVVPALDAIDGPTARIVAPIASNLSARTGSSSRYRDTMNNVKSVPAPNINTAMIAVTCPFKARSKLSANSAAIDCATVRAIPTVITGNRASSGER